MADTVGKRPTPSIARGKGSSSWDTDKTGGTDKNRESHTKTPTGNRPVPGIPAHHPPTPTVPGAVKRPIKHTSMPTPNKDRLTGASKQEGGGGY